MKEILTLQAINDILLDRKKEDRFTKLKDIPHPEQLKDMEKATGRIRSAIANKEQINIVGDYDVDGIVSTAIMVNFFNAIGIKVNYIIPNRFEHGYGLSPKIVEKIDKGLVITVDNGISALEAAQLCKEKGLELIITDHHTVGESLPEAFAIINPKQEDCNFPFKDICGAQVAWYLCASLKKTLGVQYNLMGLFDLLVLAIVADIMPMICLNHTFVKKGLEALSSSNRPAFVALKERFYLTTLNEEDIGFKIAPLINCAGRMDDPYVALEFLLSSNLQEARDALDYLIELNESRKQQQLSMFEEAKLQVDTSSKVIVVASEDWNEGIIGIVASKLCEKYKKPSFVFSIEKDKAKASCRSTPSVNLYKLIESCSECVLNFGGHKQAAGLSLETKELSRFQNMLEYKIDSIKDEEQDQGESLGSFHLECIGGDAYNLIESFRPYGHSNPYPIFHFENIEIGSSKQIGKNKEYQKLQLKDGDSFLDMLVFNDVRKLHVGEKISFLATINKNEFRQTVEYNLMLKELIET